LAREDFGEAGFGVQQGPRETLGRGAGTCPCFMVSTGPDGHRPPVVPDGRGGATCFGPQASI